MKIRTCQFVLSSDLFEGLPRLSDDFGNSDPPFSWGDNNRSLVTIRDILDHMNNSYIEHDDQISILEDRAYELPEEIETYVDLEN